MSKTKSLGQQARDAELLGKVRFKALPGTGCAKHDGTHYSSNRRCCTCDADARRIKRAESRAQKF